MNNYFDKCVCLKELEKCSHSISNLYEKPIEVMELCSKLNEIWKNGDFAKKEGLQKLLFPSGLVYDKKTHSFRTPKINSVIAEIARLSGDLALMGKRLTALKSHKSLPAEREGTEFELSNGELRRNNEIYEYFRINLPGKLIFKKKSSSLHIPNSRCEIIQNHVIPFF